MTRQQFDALPPYTLIDINGTKMTKRDFQARNQKAAEEAARMIEETKRRAKDQFDALVKKKLENDKAKLAAANKEVQAMTDRLKAGATAAAQAPDWQAREKKAAELFDQAKKLEQQADDLLAPTK